MNARLSVQALEYRRRLAVERVSEGYSQAEVAHFLGVSVSAVCSWVAAYRQRGDDGLTATRSPGAPPKLTLQEHEELERLLLEGATAYGWPNNLWTGGRVREIIKKHFGVEYHPAHVCRILKKKLDWTCQRPQHQNADRDDVAIEVWVREMFPLIMERTAARSAYTVFVDETGFMLEPIIRRTFAPRGKTPVHRISDPHGRISAIGAISISPRRDSITFMYELLADNANYRGATIAAFMRAVHSRLAGPMTVIWDQIPIHCCKPIDEFTATAPGVILEPFPPYAPELNPVDRVWGYGKYHRLPNFTPPDLGVLRSSVIQELDRVSGRCDLLRAFVRATKLPLAL
jgi:transposase